MATKKQEAAPAAGEAQDGAAKPLPVPEGGWPRDEFTGKPGRFVRDPFTGKRRPADTPTE